MQCKSYKQKKTRKQKKKKMVTKDFEMKRKDHVRKTQLD